MWLVEHFRSLGWDNEKLHDASPFRVVDPGFNAILIRSDEALVELAGDLGLGAIAAAATARTTKARAAFGALWSDAASQFLCFDRAAGRPIDSRSVGGLLPLFAGLGDTGRLAATIRRWRSGTAFGVPSHDPTDVRFDRRRYWRGPCWLIVNYMLADGLTRSGGGDVADEVIADSLALIRRSGFAEYYDPLDGAALGGGSFTWTAAMVIEFLNGRAAEAG
jgi:glycogen debranching enzyme